VDGRVNGPIVPPLTHPDNRRMPNTALPRHHLLTAEAHAVPAPFRSFAVRSDEAQHAHVARAPCGRVHVLDTPFLNDAALAQLAAEGRSRVQLSGCGDVAHAHTSAAELAQAAPAVSHVLAHLAQVLQRTGVMGDTTASYASSLNARIDYLGTWGSGFHNDVARHFSRCLFWLLVLDAADVNFVQPHAGVVWPLRPGQLLVFDPVMAHGLCRPQDGRQAIEASFDTGRHDQQIFLTGELRLSDAQWAALGSPWLPVAQHEARGALDLLLAEFDEQSGAIKRPRELLRGMHRSVCHVDRDISDDA
jgi:hypothetical protein